MEENKTLLEPGDFVVSLYRGKTNGNQYKVLRVTATLAYLSGDKKARRELGVDGFVRVIEKKQTYSFKTYQILNNTIQKKIDRDNLEKKIYRLINSINFSTIENFSDEKLNKIIESIES